MTDQDIVNEIFKIRVVNNSPWKRLMEIALLHAPSETREVLAQITQNDRDVSDWMDILARR